MPSATTPSLNQLHQIADAVSDILRYVPPLESPLVAMAPSLTVTEGSEGTIRSCAHLVVVRQLYITV